MKAAASTAATVENGDGRTRDKTVQPGKTRFQCPFPALCHKGVVAAGYISVHCYPFVPTNSTIN